MSELVRIEGVDLYLTRVVGPTDVFSAGGFELQKPRWVPDQEASTCSHCASAFSSLRRKHHCRQCGRIFCAKCCSEKLVLPQFNSTSSERVCEQCKPVAQHVALALSNKLPEKLTGVQQLVHMMDTPPGLRKVTYLSVKGYHLTLRSPQLHAQVIDSGGVQTLVFAARLRDDSLRSMACSGFNTLATHTTLHAYLLKTGIGKAIVRMLSETSPQSSDLLVSGLSVLSVICKTTQLLPQVQGDGVLDPVLSLVGAQSPTVTQMALRVLGQLVEDPQTHQAIIANKHSALSRIFRCTTDPDEQTQEMALRALALMAMGTDVTRQNIAQEDIFSGHSCQRVLRSRPHNIQVLVNAACLVSNMAASEQTQVAPAIFYSRHTNCPNEGKLPRWNMNHPSTVPRGALKDLLLPLCRLIDEHTCSPELMLHTARGIANFARNQGHAQLLIPYVTNIFRQFVMAVDTSVRYQGLRTMISLMTFFPQQTLVVLQQEDIRVLLIGLMSHEIVTCACTNALLILSPSVLPPQGPLEN